MTIVQKKAKFCYKMSKMTCKSKWAQGIFFLMGIYVISMQFWYSRSNNLGPVPYLKPIGARSLLWVFLPFPHRTRPHFSPLALALKVSTTQDKCK